MFNFAIQNVESQQSTVNGLPSGLDQKLLTNNSSFLIFYMKLAILWVGKTSTDYINKAIDTYVQRIGHYMPIEIIEVPDVKNAKNMDTAQLRQKEGELIIKQLRPDDYVVFLDDKGKQMSSTEFAYWIDKTNMNSSIKRLVFVIGGAYGFSLDAYKQAKSFLSISKMTFSHQIIRPILVEQIYRAMTILRGEPYHHEESLFSK